MDFGGYHEVAVVDEAPEEVFLELDVSFLEFECS